MPSLATGSNQQTTHIDDAYFCDEHAYTSCNGRARRIVHVSGPGASGKTGFVVTQVAGLLKEGAQAARILVVAVSSEAARAFTARLEALCGKEARAVRTATVEQVSLELLDTLGQGVRVLTPAELQVVFEDLALAGFDRKAVTAALDRRAAQMGARVLGDPSPSLDPSSCDAAVSSYLERRRVATRPDLAGLALSAYENSDKDSRSGIAFAGHVFVDDAQNVSPSSISLLAALSNPLLTLCENERQTFGAAARLRRTLGKTSVEIAQETLRSLTGETPETRLLNVGATKGCTPDVSELCRRLDDPHATTSAGVAPTTNDGTVVNVRWNDAADEFNGISGYLRTLFKNNEDMQRADVVIVAPNDAWANQMARSLQAGGTASSTCLGSATVAGNPRVPDRCGDLAALLRLRLLACPDDAFAWRSWCGMGHETLAARQWTALEGLADESQANVLDLLAGIARNPVEAARRDVQHAASRHNEMSLFLRYAAQLEGYALAKAVLEGLEAPLMARLLKSVRKDDGARALWGRVASLLLDPRFDPSTHKVRICTADKLQGLSAHVVVVGGLVDGLCPTQRALADPQGPLYQDQLCKIRAALCKSRGTLVLSGARSMEAQAAQRQGITGARTFKKAGALYAALEPARFLAACGSAVPPAVTGEQLLGGRY